MKVSLRPSRWTAAAHLLVFSALAVVVVAPQNLIALADENLAAVSEQSVNTTTARSDGPEISISVPGKNKGDADLCHARVGEPNDRPS